MRLLLDNNVSPQLVRPLRDAGHDTEHVRDHGLQAAPDATVLQRAREHDQVLISATPTSARFSPGPVQTSHRSS
jgi:predicted nuclease of predicted toxin-antitoxin system